MQFTAKTEPVEAVQLKWTSWSEVTALCAAAGLEAKGGFINQHGVYVDKAPGGPAKMGARLINPDGSGHVCHEGQWIILRANSKRRVQVLDDETFRQRYGVTERDVVTLPKFRPAWSNQPAVKLDSTIPEKPQIIARVAPPPRLDAGSLHAPSAGSSFKSVIDSVREGVAEAKAELGIE